jgi:hypothetical protein
VWDSKLSREDLIKNQKLRIKTKKFKTKTTVKQKNQNQKLTNNKTLIAPLANKNQNKIIKNQLTCYATCITCIILLFRKSSYGFRLYMIIHALLNLKLFI